jgi:hypothetical protein
VIAVVLGAILGYFYAKEIGAVFGFVIGLIIGRSLERR